MNAPAYSITFGIGALSYVRDQITYHEGVDHSWLPFNTEQRS